MFRPIAAIFRLLHLCSKSIIYIYQYCEVLGFMTEIYLTITFQWGWTTIIYRFPMIFCTVKSRGLLKFYVNIKWKEGLYSVVGIETCCRLDGLEFESRCTQEIYVFLLHTRPDRPWGSSSHLDDGYRVSILGIRQPGRGIDHQTTPSADVEYG